MTGGSFSVAPTSNKNATDLMSESYSRRSWKGIACAILVIAACAAIIAVIVVYAGPSRPLSSPGTLRLEDVFKNKYGAIGFNGTWVTGDQFVFSDKDKNIMVFNVSSKTATLLAAHQTIADIGYSSYKVSPDLKYILLIHDVSPLYRYSFTARYKIYDVVAKDIEDLDKGYTLQYADWGPKEMQLVYVKNNNIFYKPTIKNPDDAIQVTNDGVKDSVFNGIPDWVYEEEVLGSNNAISWSPSGAKLAFIKFNDTEVRDMKLMEYGTYEDPFNVYPNVVSIKYPKPGLTNPTVTLYVVDLNNHSSPTSEVKPPPEISKDHYIVAMTWATDDILSVLWVPRVQNRMVVSLCTFTISAWQCKKNSEVTTKGWLDDYTPPMFTPDGSYFLIRAYNDNYRQLIVYNSVKGSERYLTNGTSEVTGIVGYDADRNIVYYTRTEPNNPATTHVAYVNVNGTGQETCLTCDLDYECGYYAATLSKGSKYAAVRCLGGYTAEYIPWTQLRTLPDFDQVMMWENNAVLRQRLSNQTLCNFRNLSVPIKGDYTANVQLYLPKDFDHNKRYPLIIEVYGGPGSAAVKNYHSVDFGTFVASVNKIIYAKIDARGSSGRGNRLMFEVYKRLGSVEIDDQIDVAKFMGLNLSYVDPNKLAIWGWSYGGYAAASALVRGNDTFRCAMSVAPVTSWYYYDTVYTERYMLTPDQNLNNYMHSDLMSKAELFRGKKFLLIHGTADDNVHYQQSMMLTKALNRANVLFDMHIYPDENHSLSPSRLHVYQTLDSFLLKCFA